MTKAWLVIDDWRDKYPSLQLDHNAKVFETKRSADYYMAGREKRFNSILLEIELPEKHISYEQQNYTGVKQ